MESNSRDSCSLFTPPVYEAYPESFCRFWELWNAERYFECHEALEILWREASDEKRLFYNGLIHCAVALYQHRRGNAEGAARQLVRAQVKLRNFSRRYMSVDIAGLLRFVESEIEPSLNHLTTDERERTAGLRRKLLG